MAHVSLSLVDQYADKYDIPRPIFRGLVRQESGFNPDAVGPRTKYGQAEGLTQLLPSTAKSLGVSDPFEPEQNLDGGARYLRQNYDKFGSWDLALAAHNAGPGAVEKYGGIPPFKETQNYVRSIMRSAGDVHTSESQKDGPAKPVTMSQGQSAAEEGIASILRSGVVRPASVTSTSPTEDTEYPGLQDILTQAPVQEARLEPRTRQELLQPRGAPSTAAAPPIQQMAPYSQAPVVAAPLPRSPAPIGDTKIPTTTPEPQVDLRAAALGLLPPQATMGNSLLVPGVGAVPGGSDVLSQQTRRIAQTATGPLKAAINAYAQKTGGGDYIKDLVVRYTTAPLLAKEPILREADAYGLRSTVQNLSQTVNAGSTSLLPTPTG